MNFKTFLLIALPLLLTSCRLFDDETSYYGVEADGYVVYARTGLPVPGATAIVMTYFPSHGWATKQHVEEKYYADENGYYRIRFLKKVDGEEMAYNSITISTRDPENKYYSAWGADSMGSASRGFWPSTLQSAKSTIRLDTAKVYIKFG